MYRSLARWCYRRHWTVIALWMLALVGINVAGVAIGAANEGEFESPPSESTRGFETLQQYFPGASSGFGGSIVFQSADGVRSPEIETAMTELFAEVEDFDGVSVISPYSDLGASQIAADGTIAFAQINLDNDVDQTESAEIGAEIRELVPDIDGLRVEVGGAALGEFEPPESELIGLAFAIVVLIFSFGSVLAMGLPIGVALAGVVTGGFGLVTLLSNVVSVPDFAPIIGVMIGLGVGIDYALFIVTRYREMTRAGFSPEDATVGAMDTAGRAVVFAGITVVVSLMGMLLIGLSFISGLGIAAAVTVAVTLIASITLLPALLGLSHEKVEVTRWRGLIAAGFASLALLGLGLGLPALAAVGGLGGAATIVLGTTLPPFAKQLKVRPRGPIVKPLGRLVPQRRQKLVRETIAYRWSHAIQRRPWTFLLAGSAVLLLLAAPILGLRLGFSDEGNFPEATTTRQAYDLIAEGFGPGFNGPFVLAVEIDDPSDAAVVQQLPDAILADPGVASVSPPFPSDRENPPASEAFLIQIVPTTSPQDAATAETVQRLRDDLIPPLVEGTGIEANLTGAVPNSIDFTDYLSGRIIVFFAAVLGVSFLLLMMVFRSILVPLKAVIMNVLSIAAAYGVVVAIFQWGWLGSIFGVEGAPIEPFVPMMLFAIVFGLSMDYEVFLLSRVKEEYDRTGDAKNSVADGLAATARVITAAAAIMVVVFGAFLLEDDRIIKLFGTGLALAVLLDATLVRMLLVPATMELLGTKNWWIPKWLDRFLPTLNIEGPELEALHARVTDPPPTDDPQQDDEHELVGAP
ncbi:MAG TPA: MMPL family transporter [Ilumatobacter sp.]|nr:MMPL family transporter [Ilumatobacter sp.]